MRTAWLFLLIFISSITIGQESSTIFKENFEKATLQEIVKNWNDSKNVEGMSLSIDIPQDSKGTQSLMMTYTPGKDTGGHLYKMFREGYDSLFARFYVKFCDKHSKVHHLVHMGGYNPPTNWPQGGAGIRPTGNERFHTGIEPIGNRWSWDFYTYWMHMRDSGQPIRYWGNTFYPDPPAGIKRNEWICVELMMKMNDPVEEWNGEQTFWINGKKIQHIGKGFPRGYWIWDKFIPDADSSKFEGFQWRNDPELNLNYFFLLYYMTDGMIGKKDTIWFDDIVISTEYIGPNK